VLLNPWASCLAGAQQGIWTGVIEPSRALQLLLPYITGPWPVLNNHELRKAKSLVSTGKIAPGHAWNINRPILRAPQL
jgi:hypothetical protein